MKNKLYKIMFGSYSNKEDMESFNVDSVTVKAKSADLAEGVCGEYILEKEKEYKKDGYELFIESIELIDVIEFE